MRRPNGPTSYSADIARLAALLGRVRARVVLEEVASETSQQGPASTVASVSGKADQPFRLLLRVEEAAEALAVGRSTVYGLIRTGQLPCVRIGRLVRISVDDLRGLAERSRDTR